jgi:hypothetical protein
MGWPIGNEGTKPMDSLVKKLKILKSLVITSEKKKKLEAREELKKLEMELDSYYSNHLGGFEKEEDKVIVLEKE